MIFIFENDVSANALWEQMPKVILQTFSSVANEHENEHACEVLIDTETGVVYCPNCEANSNFKIKKTQSTISVIEIDTQTAKEEIACSIVKVGSIVYFEV